MDGLRKCLDTKHGYSSEIKDESWLIVSVVEQFPKFKEDDDEYVLVDGPVTNTDIVDSSIDNRSTGANELGPVKK